MYKHSFIRKIISPDDGLIIAGQKANSLALEYGSKGASVRLTWLTVFGLAWLLSGCSTMRVVSDYDATVDYAILHTYDWLPAPKIKSGDPAIQYNSLMEQRVKSAVEEQLGAKGFRRVVESPDVLVTYHVAVDQKISVTYLNDLYGYGSGWGHHRRRSYYGGYGYGYSSRGVVVNEYKQGTLIIDIVNAGDKQLIWRGTASDEIYPGDTSAEREKHVREAVQKILALFPPSYESTGE